MNFLTFFITVLTISCSLVAASLSDKVSQEPDEDASEDYQKTDKSKEVANAEDFLRTSSPSSQEGNTDLYQAVPPTEHPLERKAIKFGLAWGGVALCLSAGMLAGWESVFRFGLPIAGASTIGTIVAAVSIGLLIHYGWDFINTCFKD